MADITIRPGRAEERVLVLQSFAREYRDAPYAKGVPVNALTAMMSRFLDAWTFLVAADYDNDQVLGFIVHAAPNRVAWLQTKREYRGKGVTRALLKRAGIAQGNVVVPFLPGRTGVGENFGAFAAAHGYRLQFRPWLALHV